MHVTVVLKPRDPIGLAKLVAEVSTPGSSSYRRYLNPSEFERRFGSTTAQRAEVAEALRAQGLSPGRASVNGLSIRVSATTGQLERAFSVSLERITLRSGQSAVVSDQRPLIDASVAKLVQGVVGLDSSSPSEPSEIKHVSSAGSVPLVRPHVVTGGPQPCAAAVAAAPGQQAYTADQIASAYGFTGLYQSGDEGAGQTVALYELEPFDPNDIAAYQACYGTDATVTTVSVDGGAGSGPGSGEAALDIEELIGLAPEANILVYDGPDSSSGAPGSGPYDTLSAIITQDRAKVISTSWGQCEEIEGSTDANDENTLFEEAAVQGQSVVAASGDDGSEDCDTGGRFGFTALAVDDPSDQPFVTGVGGTSRTAIGPPPTQTVWNSPSSGYGVFASGGGAGGGGISSLFAMPAYQSDAPSSLNVINSHSSGTPCQVASGYCRETPDVSADADPDHGVLIYWNGSGDAGAGEPQGWLGTGGTSASAPIWAALLTLADASSACQGIPVGFANPALYHAAATAYASDFNDITEGNNDFTGTSGGAYPAGVGYSMAAGLGTPVASNLVASLCAENLTLTDPGNLATVVGSAVSRQITADDLAGATLTYTAAGLPDGLALDGSTGLITGTPLSTGSSTVTVTVNDTRVTQSTTFVWTIAARPKVSSASLTGLATKRPKLAFTLTAGRSEPLLKTVSITLPSGLTITHRTDAIKLTTSAGRRVRFTALRSGHALVLDLLTAQHQVRITIQAPTIAAKSVVVAKARAARRQSFDLTVSTTDTAGNQVRLTKAITTTWSPPEPVRARRRTPPDLRHLGLSY